MWGIPRITHFWGDDGDREARLKYALTLFVALVINWMLWSGHFNNAFLLILGILSSAFCVWLASRMRIVDEEGAPAHLGVRPFFTYAPWLVGQIVISNIAVAKIILSRAMPMYRNTLLVPTSQHSELGRVIMANSITLTPGTVSVMFEGDEILVHGLSLHQTAEDLTGDMDRRICALERSSDKPSRRGGGVE